MLSQAVAAESALPVCLVSKVSITARLKTKSGNTGTAYIQ